MVVEAGDVVVEAGDVLVEVGDVLRPTFLGVAPRVAPCTKVRFTFSPLPTSVGRFEAKCPINSVPLFERHFCERPGKPVNCSEIESNGKKSFVTGRVVHRGGSPKDSISSLSRPPIDFWGWHHALLRAQKCDFRSRPSRPPCTDLRPNVRATRVSSQSVAE